MSEIMPILSSILVIIGSAVLVLAALGLIKFPDLLTRMAAVGKASTLALLLIGMSLCVEFTAENRLKIVIGLLVYFLTSPTASHLIAQSGLKSGARLFSKTKVETD